MYRKIVLSIVFITCLVFFGAAQDKERVVGEVTVKAVQANTDPNYVQLRKMSENADSFSSEYATVNNLVLKRDAATFNLRSGEIYFSSAIAKRVAICALNDVLATKIENVKK